MSAIQGSAAPSGTAARAIPAFRLLLWGELARFFGMAAEVIWVTNWFEPLVQSRAPYTTSLGLITLAVFGSHFFLRLMNTFHWHIGLRRAALLAWIIALILGGLAFVLYPDEHLSLGELMLRPILTMTLSTQSLRDIWQILVILALTWRAVGLGREQVSLEGIQGSFQFGLLWMLFYGLLFSWVKPQQAILTLYAFLFFSLIAMSSARISGLIHLRGGKLPEFNITWSLGIIGTAVVLVGMGVFTGWAISSWAIDAAAKIISAIIIIVMLVSLVVLSPLLLLIMWLIPGLQGLVETLLNSNLFAGLRALIALIAQSVQEFPAWLVTAVKIIVPLVILAGIGLIVVMILYGIRLRQKQKLLVGESGELGMQQAPILELPIFRGSRLLKRLFGRGNFLAAVRIRWIYAQLMVMCTELGNPRPPSRTPLEFLPELEQMFPEDFHALRKLTQAYGRVRYGEFPEDQAEVDELDLGWKEIRTHGKKALAIRKKEKSLLK